MNEYFDETNAGPALAEVDRLLTDFFQAEMPRPWPQRRRPYINGVRRAVPRFSHNVRRLAIAASVALALLAYWGLAGMFSHSATSALPGNAPEIGHRHPVKHLAPMERQRTPAGNDAQLFEEDTPSGVVINVIGPSNSKGPR